MWNWREYRFVLIFSVIALIITSIPYGVGVAMATDERIFGGFVYAIEDCYSYLAKMRQGADGAWLFHISYTPEPHPGALFYPFYLLLGRIAAQGCRLSPLSGANLTSWMVWVYHLARWIFGLGLLVTIYRFLATLTERLVVRRLAWLMVTFGAGLGWLLISLGQSDWLGSLPLDFILPEGFTFLVLYAFPHIAFGRTLLLWGILSLLRAWHLEPRSEQRKGSGASPDSSRSNPISWACMTGFLWLVMGLIVPFYVAVAWAVAGATWIVLALRERRIPWTKASLMLVTGLISVPAVLYSAWRFTSDPIYAAWAAQNRILSPHPLHYLTAYGIQLALAAFAVRRAWRRKRPTWLALAWLGVVPLLIYLPFNLQRRLVEGVQVPLSLLAAMGLMKIIDVVSNASRLKSQLMMGVLLIVLLPTNLILIAGNTMALQGLPNPIFRDRQEIATLRWLDQQTDPSDIVLASYETGNYLPARVSARVFLGHGSETAESGKKKAQVAKWFNAATDHRWRRNLLGEFGIDYVFWGPKERELGAFDPRATDCLEPVYGRDGYFVFEVLE